MARAVVCAHVCSKNTCKLRPNLCCLSVEIRADLPGQPQGRSSPSTYQASQMAWCTWVQRGTECACAQQHRHYLSAQDHMNGCAIANSRVCQPFLVDKLPGRCPRRCHVHESHRLRRHGKRPLCRKRGISGGRAPLQTKRVLETGESFQRDT